MTPSLRPSPRRESNQAKSTGNKTDLPILHGSETRVTEAACPHSSQPASELSASAHNDVLEGVGYVSSPVQFEEDPLRRQLLDVVQTCQQRAWSLEFITSQRHSTRLHADTFHTIPSRMQSESGIYSQSILSAHSESAAVPVYKSVLLSSEPLRHPTSLSSVSPPPYQSIFRKGSSFMEGYSVSIAEPGTSAAPLQDHVEHGREIRSRVPENHHRQKPPAVEKSSLPLAIQIYRRSRSLEVAKCLKDASNDFNPSKEQLEYIYDVMWEFETNSVRHYYQKVESAVHYLHGTESQYRYPPLDYVKPEPSTDDTRSSLSMNQDIDLFDLLYVFKSFDSQIPTHMPVNVKTLKQYHNICESRRHHSKFGPTPQATPKSTPQSTPPPTASRIQGPSVLNSKGERVMLKPLDDILPPSLEAALKEREGTKASPSSNYKRKREKTAKRPLQEPSSPTPTPQSLAKKARPEPVSGMATPVKPTRIRATPQKAKSTSAVASETRPNVLAETMKAFQLFTQLHGVDESAMLAALTSTMNPGNASTMSSVMNTPTSQISHSFAGGPSGLGMPGSQQMNMSPLQLDSLLDMNTFDSCDWMWNSSQEIVDTSFLSDPASDILGNSVHPLLDTSANDFTAFLSNLDIETFQSTCDSVLGNL